MGYVLIKVPQMMPVNSISTILPLSVLGLPSFLRKSTKETSTNFSKPKRKLERERLLLFTWQRDWLIKN
jgi:hypothetical protein